jgi:hypothetical protein
MIPPTHETHSVRPEPVEGLSFVPASTQEAGQGFDKLSPNGVGLGRSSFSALRGAP